MQPAFGRFIDSQVDTSTERNGHANPNEAPLIKFARFKDGTLGLFQARTDSLEYITFSHVWGKWSWRCVPGIPYEVKASQEKADFIAKEDG
jgi:hypothetical protein